MLISLGKRFWLQRSKASPLLICAYPEQIAANGVGDQIANRAPLNDGAHSQGFIGLLI